MISVITSRRILSKSSSITSTILRAQSACLPTQSIQTRSLRSLADLENPTSSTSTTTATTNPFSSNSTIEPIKPSSSTPLIPHSKPQKPLTPGLILTLSCPDKPGIVSKVTSYLASRGCNILDSAQYFDQSTKTFFMRVHSSWQRAEDQKALKNFKEDFGLEIAKEMKMDFDVKSDEGNVRTMIMVSKIGHCLHHLLFLLSSASIPIQVPLIVSNHSYFAPLAAAHGIPFYHLPIDEKNGKTKEWQEDQLLKLCEEYDVELVVLARYMQILSPKLCEAMSGKIINIHHSFLPSFKGAKPYHQAHSRGVKLIGATAHFVTSDLDEGPIIEQAVERVTHAETPSDLVRAGSDVETRVLARAVRWVGERRVLMNGGKTVVFN